MKPKPILIAIIAAAGGWFAATNFQDAHFSNEAHAKETTRALASQCQMHPWITSDKPNRCTICGMNLTLPREATAAAKSSAGNVVVLRADSITALGVRTDEVRPRPLVRTLRVAGMIGEDESRHRVISAPAGGRVDGVGMSCEGEQLTRRQPMLTLFSRTLLKGAADYRTALTQDAAAIEKAKSHLLQCGLVEEQIAAIPQRRDDDLHFGILAPQGGTILQSFVAEGQYVREGEKLFEVADFRTMWFNFTAYEADLPFIQKGRVVAITTPSLPGQSVRARVAFIHPNLDEATRSTRVRVVLENPDGRFKNNTFAQGVVELDAPEVLAVPRTAVLRPGDAARVFVEMEPGHFQQRAVKLGRIGDALCEVLDGVKAGERVVTSGGLLLDAQAQLNEFAKLPTP
ncbi:MAG: efflux RND transporter periplasmic adaptor subunit [Verrucomicrobia bacterium]|nr:efflux RND transporter periplasmic adaptor subunit [Verrucomicrobiota bacterium]